MLRFTEYITVPANGQYDVNFFNSFQSDESIILSFQDYVSGYTTEFLDMNYQQYRIWLDNNVLSTNIGSNFNEVRVANYVKLTFVLPSGFVRDDYVRIKAPTTEQLELKVSASTVKGFIEPHAYVTFSGMFNQSGTVELLRMAYHPHAIINGQIDAYEADGNVNNLYVYRYTRDGYLDGMYTQITTYNDTPLKADNLYIGSGFSLRIGTNNVSVRYNGYFKIKLF